MLVAINAEAPACYAISGIPALPTSASGFFGCRTENSALLSEFKIPDDPIFHVCSLHQQWKRLHVTLVAVLSVPFLCCCFEHCMWSLCGDNLSSGLGWYYNANNRTQPLLRRHTCCFPFFYLLTHWQELPLASIGQIHQWHVQQQNSMS